MAFDNFKPTVWSAYIQHQLERKCRLENDCWKQFEGEAKRGREVKILGVGTPTIDDYTGASIGAPEVVSDNSSILKIDQAKFFNFAVDDVDRAQSIKGLMEAILEEATRAMAVLRDQYVGEQAKDAGKFSSSLAIATAAEAKAAIDDAILYLRENDVEVEGNVVIELPPFVYAALRDQMILLKTDNDELIAKGVVGMYDNCRVKISNNLYNDGTDFYAMVRTKRAIAFASSIDEVEAYRPDDLFCDAVRGLNCYGAKVIRPNELYVIKCHKSA